jgi:hypothetical protein
MNRRHGSNVRAPDFQVLRPKFKPHFCTHTQKSMHKKNKAIKIQNLKIISSVMNWFIELQLSKEVNFLRESSSLP